MDYCSVTDSPTNFGNCLAGFSVQELLVLKKSMERMDMSLEAPAELSTLESRQLKLELEPQRMALMAAERGDHAEHWHTESPAHWPEHKPSQSKLQTLFQISITALTFLSFGGYLLCLIVQAIKSKGTIYYHPVSTESTASTSGNVKRIKVYRRSKRSRANGGSNIFAQNYASYVKAVRGKGQGQGQDQGHGQGYAYLVGS